MSEPTLDQIRDDLAQAWTDDNLDWLHDLGLLLATRVEQAERERDEYRDANESVRVCADHTREIVDGRDCVICENRKLREALEEACDWLVEDLGHAPDTTTACADRELVARWRGALAEGAEHAQ